MTGGSRAERAEGVVLVLILLVVGGLAGAASFTHVHDWTLANSPTGTGQWFGWANAAISEPIPLAALLTIRRRRRTGQPFGYPMFLLVAAVALSLSAQLAVAKPGPSGWLLSAVPALAFLGLSKLVLAAAPVPSSPSPVTCVVPGGTSSQTHQGSWTPESVLTKDGRDESEDGERETVSVDRVIREAERPTLVPVPAAAFARPNGNRSSTNGAGPSKEMGQ